MTVGQIFGGHFENQVILKDRSNGSGFYGWTSYISPFQLDISYCFAYSTIISLREYGTTFAKTDYWL